MTKNVLFITGLLFLTTLTFSHADVLSIAEQDNISNSASGVLRPVNGLSMQQVEQRFGQAENESAAVGQPPITVWSYSDFKVYFEEQTVIHSVVIK